MAACPPPFSRALDYRARGRLLRCAGLGPDIRRQQKGTSLTSLNSWLPSHGDHSMADQLKIEIRSHAWRSFRKSTGGLGDSLRPAKHKSRVALCLRPIPPDRTKHASPQSGDSPAPAGSPGWGDHFQTIRGANSSRVAANSFAHLRPNRHSLTTPTKRRRT